MATSITPGRLAKWGLVFVLAGLLCVLLTTLLADTSWSDGPLMLAIRIVWAFFYVSAGLLLVAAFIAKVVQIGVRSARDE